ncbi:MAG: T9SS type A sorting domain-containing protein [Lewinellaceae bacterium]|nr:T9SS type A sorting domain-containing protein [Lewinellaceae bacterium]
MKCFLLALSFVAPMLAQCQNYWERTYGGPKSEQGITVLSTSDDKILIGGRSESFHEEDSWAYLAKLNMDGSIIWQKTYNLGSFWNVINDVVEIPDNGGFLAVGEIWDSCGGTSFLLRLDTNGDTVWTKSLCIEHVGKARSISMTSDNNFIIDIPANIFGFYKFQLVKIDQDGNVIWSQSYFSPSSGYSSQVIETQDEGYIVVGSITLTANGPTDAYIIKTDENGNELWNLSIGGDGAESASDVIELENGDLLILGSKPENSTDKSDVFLARVSPDGDLLWINEYGEENRWDRSAKLSATSDKGFVIVGNTSAENYSYEKDYFLSKLDEEFDLTWHKTYGGDDEDIARDVTQTSDGGYCIIGNSRSFGDSNRDIYVVKTDPLGVSSRNLLKGIAYFDIDNSCMYDSQNEPVISNVVVSIEGSDTIKRLSNIEGEYSALILPGTYEVVPGIFSPYFEFCNFPQQLVLPNQDDTTSLNIALEAIVNCPYLSVDISSPFTRRCFDNNIYVSYCNYGTVPTEYTYIEVSLDSFYSFNNSSIPPVSQENNVIVFEVPSLGVWECGNFEINATLSCDAELGLSHCISAHIYPDTLCLNDIDSPFTSIECQNNIGAFDPNDKRGFTNGKVSEELIEKETEIKYQIRFQNTGTDTAFTVVLIDTLSSHLDINTLRVGASSHSFNLELLDSRILKWTFSDIRLVDSLTNEAESKGFVNFFIKPNANSLIGTEIRNLASIYFDFNEPITTNITLHTIGDLATGTSYALPGTTDEFDFLIHPNPAGEYSIITLEKFLPNGVVMIYDVCQRLVKSLSFEGKTTTIDLKNFPNGIYFVAIRNKTGIVKTKKLIISK